MTVTRLYPTDTHYGANLRSCIGVTVLGNTNREVAGKHQVQPAPRELKRFLLHGVTNWSEVQADLKPILESARMDGAIVKRVQLRVYRLEMLPADAPRAAFSVAQGGTGYCFEVSIGGK